MSTVLKYQYLKMTKFLRNFFNIRIFSLLFGNEPEKPEDNTDDHRPMKLCEFETQYRKAACVCQELLG
jgi:hypothetical protein